MLQTFTSKKFGYYKRKNIVFMNRLVTIRGLAIFPGGPPGRKWMGLAWIKSQNITRPAPASYIKHDQKGMNHAIDYNPLSE